MLFLSFSLLPISYPNMRINLSEDLDKDGHCQPAHRVGAVFNACRTQFIHPSELKELPNTRDGGGLSAGRWLEIISHYLFSARQKPLSHLLGAMQEHSWVNSLFLSLAKSPRSRYYTPDPVQEGRGEEIRIRCSCLGKSTTQWAGRPVCHSLFCCCAETPGPEATYRPKRVFGLIFSEGKSINTGGRNVGSTIPVLGVWVWNLYWTIMEMMV